jgi:hypothetical protein
MARPIRRVTIVGLILALTVAPSAWGAGAPRPERGRLPAAAMPIFWELAVEADEVGEAWPESRFLDRRFIDSFEAWAPDPARP